MKKLNKILSALALIGLAPFSFAATSASANFQAIATLSSFCVVTAINCSNLVPYSLSTNAGSGTMAGGTGNTDSGYTTFWGDGTTESKVSLTGTGVTQNSTVYRTLSLNQYIKPDNLTVTLSY